MSSAAPEGAGRAERGAPSLHLRVLGWLVVPLALMSGAMLVEVHYSANRSTQRIQDQMLLAQAFGISEHVLGTLGDLLLLDIIQQTSADTVFYRVEGPANAFVSGYSALPRLPAGVALDDGDWHFFYGPHRGRRMRVVALRTLVEGRELNGWMTVYVAQPTDARERLVWDAVGSSTLRLGLLVLIAAILAWAAVSKGLRPLVRLERAIGRRSVEDLRPIEVTMPKEATNVVRALNALLGRLQVSIERNKRFVSDASHQLRTPVASLLAQTELALRESGEGEQSAPVRRVHATAVKMSRLITQLLSLARADSYDRIQQDFVPVDVARLARDITADRVPSAVERGLDLGFDGDGDAGLVDGNETLLGEMLANLIDNACQYCPAGSEITVAVARADAGVTLTVRDDGPGIPAGDRQRVLERFTRLDVNATEGSGLGLPIALEVAELHGGRLTLGESPGGHGLEVRVALPLAAGR